MPGVQEPSVRAPAGGPPHAATNSEQRHRHSCSRRDRVQPVSALRFTSIRGNGEHLAELAGPTNGLCKQECNGAADWQSDPRAAEDVTPQPERQHIFQHGEYRVSTRGAAGWWRDPNESALPFRVTKVNRSSIHFVNLADDQQRDIHKRVQYDDLARKYYVPMGQRYRLYDS